MSTILTISNKVFFFWFQLAISGIAFIAIFLFCYTNEGTLEFDQIRTDLIAVSGVFSGILTTYLVSKAISIRQEKQALFPALTQLTQMVHSFRKVVNELLRSNIWPSGLSTFMNHNYGDITYIDVDLIRFAGSRENKRVSQFIQDRKFGDIKYLYLELKSFIFNIPFDKALYSNYHTPDFYHIKTIERWLTHHCGNCLFYYFDHKWADAKASIFLTNLGSREDEIRAACMRIDSEKYEKMPFDHKFLSALGSHFNGEILPKLYDIQSKFYAPFPRIFHYAISLIMLSIVLGILMPIFSNLFNLPKIFDIISLSSVATILIYFTLSFRGFLRREIEL